MKRYMCDCGRMYFDANGIKICHWKHGSLKYWIEDNFIYIVYIGLVIFAILSSPFVELLKQINK